MPRLNVRTKRHGEFHHVFHAGNEQLLHARGLPEGAVDDELVVDLQDQLRLEAASLSAL